MRCRLFSSLMEDRGLYLSADDELEHRLVGGFQSYLCSLVFLTRLYVIRVMNLIRMRDGALAYPAAAKDVDLPVGLFPERRAVDQARRAVLVDGVESCSSSHCTWVQPVWLRGGVRGESKAGSESEGESKSKVGVLMEKANDVDNLSSSGFRRLPRNRRVASSSPREKEAVSREAKAIGWDSLPSHLQENILMRVEYEGLFRFKTVSQSCKRNIEADTFCEWRGASSPSEGSFTAINYYMKNKAWQCNGFDLNSRMWRSLPTLSQMLPTPDGELFKEYSVCGHGGLMCAEVSKLPKKCELVVFNPLTGKKCELPSLINPRTPVLVHISVNPMTKSYKVVVAGSSSGSDKDLSKNVEVYDSELLRWEEAPDVPGPAFGLNEHQSGVNVDGVLYFISFMKNSYCKGVVAFDMENKKWLDNKSCPIQFSTYSNTLQLVECNGKVYLFSEQEQGGSIEHCIDVLEVLSPSSEEGFCRWKNVIRVTKSGGRGLQVYPEFICVGFGDEKLCIFNTLTHDGLVYDMQDKKLVELLEPPPSARIGDHFFSLNASLFKLQLNFYINP